MSHVGANARRALRSSFDVNLRSIAPVTGVITALPVASVFAIGLAVHNPRAAISMAIGANLVLTRWRSVSRSPSGH